MSARVLVGMSGGVDSAAAALLLKSQGYEVEGVTLRLWGGGGEEDAEKVCGELGITHSVLPLEERFARDVIEYFAGRYTAGLTPNPCVRCNRLVKMAALAEAAKERGCLHFATGHYARVLCREDRHILLKARHIKKDQSYALCGLTPQILSMLLLPLGDYSKEDARAAVQKAGLHLAAKPDSQDICFIPDGDYAGFLERLHPGKNPGGSFVDEEGNILGPHKGIWNYTVGQRKGLGLAFGKPIFVRRIDPATGNVELAEDSALFSSEFIAGPVNWVDRDSLTGSDRFELKIRYGAAPVPATVSPMEDGMVKVQIDTPQRAITPGQSAVFYRGDVLSGGGEIR